MVAAPDYWALIVRHGPNGLEFTLSPPSCLHSQLAVIIPPLQRRKLGVKEVK